MPCGCVDAVCRSRYQPSSFNTLAPSLIKKSIKPRRRNTSRNYLFWSFSEFCLLNIICEICDDGCQISFVTILYKDSKNSSKRSTNKTTIQNKTKETINKLIIDNFWFFLLKVFWKNYFLGSRCSLCSQKVMPPVDSRVPLMDRWGDHIRR